MPVSINFYGQYSPQYTSSSLQKSQNLFDQAASRLNTGLRINRAKDDAAGLSISEHLRYQVNGTYQAMRNAQNGFSQLAIAEGGLSQSTELLQRMREMAVQAANGTLSNQERKIMNIEFNQYKEELTRIAKQTQYNGRNLLDGTFEAKYQVGGDSGQNVKVSIDDMSAEGIGLDAVNISTTGGANNALATIDKALENVVKSRAKIGASQNRLEFTVNAQNYALENLTRSESRIRDADIAEEVMNLTKAQLLMQTQYSVANLQKPNAAMMLSLLRT